MYMHMYMNTFMNTYIHIHTCIHRYAMCMFHYMYAFIFRHIGTATEARKAASALNQTHCL